MTTRQQDSNLKNALMKAYSARASLFHRGVGQANMREMFAVVDALAPITSWDLPALRITQSAFTAVENKRIAAHKIFVHPDILQAAPSLIPYYRNLVALSQKGMSQLGLPVGRFERGKSPKMSPEVSLAFAQTLNPVICQVIDATPDFSLDSGRHVVFAEIGSELQGSWVNVIGKGAAKAVEDLLAQYIATNNLGRRDPAGVFTLANGWRIACGSEPDILFTDSQGTERIAVEIKGSLDRAGAQTRYGEAKKSFAGALARNPRCETIYLASCFTDAVHRQIQADGQVRHVFNLTSILYDQRERDRFVRQVFHIVSSPA